MTRTLAGTDVRIPDMGVGTWAWGDKSTWGMGSYDTALTEQTIRDAWDACIERGVTLFDTAEVYGDGESERIIGRLLKADAGRRPDVVIATKFMPLPWKLNVNSALVEAAKKSCERMGIDKIDLYQLHGPISLRSHGALAEAMATAKQQGLIDGVGVSNYSAKETRAMATELEKRGLKLASNQFELSLLRTAPIDNGLVAACADLGVTVLAYSPIGQGRLTGKYSAQDPPPGSRNFSAHPMEKVDTVVSVLRRIGKAHDRTRAQVALQWLIAKGAVPIPGAKNRQQAEDNAGGMGWSLAPAEVAELDAAGLSGIRTLQSRFWQHG
ncbi:MAG TPA: aldo/keto reductase [Acidimicrobiales bacterium]|nr:aldo/keto reductase [Acidimicrobiales bacterium]